MVKATEKKVKEKKVGTPEKPVVKSKSRKANTAYGCTTSFDSASILVNPIRQVIDFTISPNKHIDTFDFFSSEHIDILCSLEQFKKKEFKPSERREAVLYFLEELRQLEINFEGKFINDPDYGFNENNTILFRQDILNDTTGFLPHSYNSISLKTINSIVSAEVWKILCPILYSIGGNICMGFKHYIAESLDQNADMLKDNLDADEENIQDNLEDRKRLQSYYRKYGKGNRLGTIQKKIPELFCTYTKEEIEKAWTELGNRYFKIKEGTRLTNEEIVVWAFFQLFSIRNHEDHIENYCSGEEDIRFHTCFFFYWDEDTFYKEAQDSWHNMEFANSNLVEPYRVIDLQDYPKLEMPDTTFISAIREFAHAIDNIL